MVYVNLFVNHSVSSLRIYFGVIHFVATFFLTWTRVDSINASFDKWGDSFSDYQYSYRESSYVGYISTGMIFLIFNFIFFLCSGFQDKSFFSLMTLFLDICGTFFCFWIAVDGLEWTTYIYVWLFCAFLPFLYNLCRIIVVAVSKTQTPWQENRANPVIRWCSTTYFTIREAFTALQESFA